MKNIDTVILFRHGRTPENDFIDGVDAASRTEAQLRKDFDSYNMDLNAQGREDGLALRAAMSGMAISLCLTSPFKRTRRMAKLYLKEPVYPFNRRMACGSVILAYLNMYRVRIFIHYMNSKLL